MTITDAPEGEITAAGVKLAGAGQSAPLTRAQESLYFLDRLTNGLPVYHMPQAFRLRGKLDLAALTQGLELIVERHKALRTYIRETEQGPVQEVHSPQEMVLSLYDLSSLEETRREESFQTQLNQAIRQPFQLSSEAPFRVCLFRLAPQEHVLLFVLHHIVGDMSSLGILYRELETAYESFRNQTASSLGASPFQLSEYAKEQRERDTSAESLKFWRDRLSGFTGESEFPLDYSRPKIPTFRGGVHYFSISSGLSSALTKLARANRCSMYMLCLAALEILVYRYSSQNRFTIGTPFSERDDLKLENTIGYLINLLPIPCELAPDQTFREFLAKVRNRCLEAFSHHDISFRRILQEQGITSEYPKPPLARIVFQHFASEATPLHLTGLEVEPMRVHTGTSKFDLCFTFAEEKEGIQAEVEYDADLFESASVERISRHFLVLLESISKNLDSRISELSLMDDLERIVLNHWNETATEYPRDLTVTQLFEKQAEQNPERTALLFDDKKVSYAALNARADKIASSLQACGVKAGEFVGVCLDRSPALVACLIAVLKCGAAFVPLDASYPETRLKYLFADANIRLLITDSRHAQIAPSGTSTLLLDNFVATDRPFVQVRVAATDPAYLMYTSGSTGNPKGVVIPHRAIARLVKSTNFARFSKDDVFLLFAPTSFDASTLEIWGPLLNGATLAIYPPCFESIEQFAEVLERYRVTTLWLTAGLFNTIVDRQVESLKDVRQLLIGGDVLSVPHVRKALGSLPNTRIVNGYGPTENTTFTCCYRIPRDLRPDRSIPIGKPVSNTQAYILDENLQPVPIGIPGNLYAAGDGLSLGYWNQPELTARAFIKNPFDKTGNTKIYDTGDRARFLEDGNIEFLGRRDSQVKIRGFRIELGEVESALRQLSGIEDGATIVQEDGNGGKTLVAFIVGKSGSPDPAKLMDEISTLLPSHACPSRIIPVDKLPLGPNGKVDKRALSLQACIGPSEKTEVILPSTPTEARVAEIWRHLLKVASLSVDSNFFHLGGESLLAMRAISQINKDFTCHLTLARLFEAPTVRGISKFIESAVERSPGEGNAPTRAGSRTRPDLDSLSDSEIDVLLNELMAKQ
jgi:amino acid adenylation domain-containing protein